jgi:hypothetical protein
MKLMTGSDRWPAGSPPADRSGLACDTLKVPIRGDAVGSCHGN